MNDLAFCVLVIEEDFVHRFVGLIGNGIQSPGASLNGADLLINPVVTVPPPVPKRMETGPISKDRSE